MLAERRMTAKEALDVFGNIRFTISNYSHLEIVNQNEAKTAFNVLKELVERDTPMKVEHRYKLGKIIDYYCPNCSVYICFSDSVSEPVKYQHCPECGQRLGWEE